MTSFYERHNANIHRATHELGEEATAAYEGARIKVARFIGAADETEVVFTKNVSEAINLVAYSIGNAAAGPLRSARATRSSSPRWSITPTSCPGSCSASGPAPRCAGSASRRTAGCDEADDLINERTKIVAVAHQSNVLGTINPVAEIAARAHAVGALVLVDAAQSVPHGLMDVSAIGADFVGFTGHKMCGPTGIGVLWARRELLDAMPPFLGGGEMIETVWMDRSTYAPPPHKFEAGTMPIAQAVGLGAAVDYLSAIGPGDRSRARARAGAARPAPLAEIDGLRILGPTSRWTAAARSRSRWTRFTRTTSARCSTTAASRCGPAITARGRCTGRSACRRPPGQASTCTTRQKRSTRWQTE